MKIMALEQSTVNAERATSRWLEDWWEDSQEKTFPRDEATTSLTDEGHQEEIAQDSPL